MKHIFECYLKYLDKCNHHETSSTDLAHMGPQYITTITNYCNINKSMAYSLSIVILSEYNLMIQFIFYTNKILSFCISLTLERQLNSSLKDKHKYLFDFLYSASF